MQKFFAASARAVAVAVVLAAFLLGPLSAPADAHESRTVGDFEMVVGWGEEPAFTGFNNRVQLVLSDADDNPITDLGDSLEVEVSFGEEVTTLAVEPQFVVDAFGQPGDYGADLIPTRPGTYTFRFVGTIQGEDVDETFVSGPETFDEPREPSAVAFPAKDPSNAELAARLDQEVSRLSDDDSDGLARTLGIGGLAVGAVALAAGAVAFRRSRTTTVG